MTPPQLINPTINTNENNLWMKRFFDQHADKPKHWRAGVPYQMQYKKGQVIEVVTLVFTHDMIAFIKKKEEPAEHIAIYRGYAPLGQGSFGTVMEIEGVWCLKDGSCEWKPKNENKRVIKRGRDVRMSNELESLFKKEQRYNKDKQSRLKTRFPCTRTQSGIFLQMRKIPGVELRSIIQKLQTDAYYLSNRQCMALIIALLEAYKTQILNRKIIHCDIKPDNIICDLDTNEITFLDFGFAHRDRQCTFQKGAKRYLDPAVRDKKLKYRNPEADIYSLMVCILKILGGVPHYWSDISDVMKREAITPIEFHKRPILNNKIKNKLSEILRQSTEYNQAERLNLKTLQEKFQELFEYFNQQEAFLFTQVKNPAEWASFSTREWRELLAFDGADRLRTILETFKPRIFKKTNKIKVFYNMMQEKVDVFAHAPEPLLLFFHKNKIDFSKDATKALEIAIHKGKLSQKRLDFLLTLGAELSVRHLKIWAKAIHKKQGNAYADWLRLGKKMKTSVSGFENILGSPEFLKLEQRDYSLIQAYFSDRVWDDALLEYHIAGMKTFDRSCENHSKTTHYLQQKLIDLFEIPLASPSNLLDDVLKKIHELRWSWQPLCNNEALRMDLKQLKQSILKFKNAEKQMESLQKMALNNSTAGEKLSDIAQKLAIKLHKHSRLVPSKSLDDVSKWLLTETTQAIKYAKQKAQSGSCVPSCTLLAQ